MSAKRPPIPPAGPPRKGFWGFIASFFPSRPKILIPPREDVTLAGTTNAPPGELPKTSERAAPNTEGKRYPPTVPIPPSLKAPAPTENNNFPPPLSTRPSANRKPPFKQ